MVLPQFELATVPGLQLGSYVIKTKNGSSLPQTAITYTPCCSAVLNFQEAKQYSLKNIYSDIKPKPNFTPRYRSKLQDFHQKKCGGHLQQYPAFPEKP